MATVRAINLSEDPAQGSPIDAPRVFVKNRWMDDWQVSDYYHPLFVNFVSPTGRAFSSARLQRRYGYGSRQGEATPSRHLPATDRPRTYVAILDTGYQFCGTIETDANRIEGRFEGSQTFVAHGLEACLLDWPVKDSIWFDERTGILRRAGEGLTFNRDGIGNRSPNKLQVGIGKPTYLFSRSSDAVKWSTRDIVEYLIVHQTPPETDIGVGELERIPFILDDADRDYLPNFDQPELATHGIETGLLFDQLINRSRFLMWWIEYKMSTQQGIADTVNLRIKTLAEEDIVIDGANVIRENPDHIEIRRDTAPSASMITVTDSSHAYDQVIAQGARRRNCFTIRWNGGSESRLLDPNWDSAELTAYNVGGSTNGNFPAATEIRDRRRYVNKVRNEPQARRVFKEWKLRTKREWPSSDGYQVYRQELAKRTPIIDENREELPAFAVVLDPRDNNQYKFIQDLGGAADLAGSTDEAELKWGAIVRTNAEQLLITIDITNGPQHLLGKDQFEAIAGVDEIDPEVDWREFYFTIAVVSDRRVEGVYPPVAGFLHDSQRTLIIDASDGYRLDWLADGTVLGPANTQSGGLEQISAIGGIFVNDDRAELLRIARAAYQWYSKWRSAVVLTTGLSFFLPQFTLGDYVRRINQGNSQLQINSCITSIRLDYSNRYSTEPIDTLEIPKITVRTSWGQFDPNQFAKPLRRIAG